ncbi:hypothetical protein GCM10018785_24350 [Streptomyces longispororuber]|uniref:PE-PGRS family protein n=1 Tax=Streptomyces longispororuber TaxID=68230 RepID=A0A919DLB6_9ACTN|nr:hypothetical protein GCM10018785_24350 [Streptomyces longispororuber]
MFAAACVLLAATGHALMSAAPLPWWALPSAGAATFAGAWFLAGRERGVLVVTSASVVAQGALHAWFSLAQTVARPPAAGGTSVARQWARHLLCGAGGTAEMSEADALRVVTDAGLGGRLHEAVGQAGHAGHAMGLRDAVPSGHGGHDMSHLSSAGGGGAPNGTMSGAAGAVDTVDAAGAVDAVSGAADGMQGLHGGHVMGGLHDLHGTPGTHGGDLMGDLHGGHLMTGLHDLHAGHAEHDMGGMSPLGMLAAHLLAALLCGLWLAYGERAAFRIGRAVAGWLAAPLRLVLPRPLPPHRPQPRPRRDHGARRLRRLLLVHALTTRGPPPGLAVG